MKTYPLQSMTMEQAQQKQFRLVDIICQHFPGSDFLTQGDLGLVPGLNQPQITQRVEHVLADFFSAEAAALVGGAGTGALRAGLAAILKPSETLLVHDAPIYPTTRVSIEQMGIQVILADFNQLADVKRVIALRRPQACLIQHTRQKIDDRYHLADIIELMNENNIPTIIDDNYAVMKVSLIGCEAKASLSTFSSFKLLGPAGVGVIAGEQQWISKIRASMYSGGSQIQGYQAMEMLRGLVFSPVTHAVQARVNDELVARLNKGEVSAVKHAFLANAQSKVLLVEFNQPIAKQVLAKAKELGALPYPVGAESRFEIPPLFYRVSGTFLEASPELEQRVIRINPNRSGTETIMRILRESCGE